MGLGPSRGLGRAEAGRGGEWGGSGRTEISSGCKSLGDRASVTRRPRGTRRRLSALSEGNPSAHTRRREAVVEMGGEAPSWQGSRGVKGVLCLSPVLVLS